MVTVLYEPGECSLNTVVYTWVCCVSSQRHGAKSMYRLEFVAIYVLSCLHVRCRDAWGLKGQEIWKSIDIEVNRSRDTEIKRCDVISLVASGTITSSLSDVVRCEWCVMWDVIILVFSGPMLYTWYRHVLFCYVFFEEPGKFQWAQAASYIYAYYGKPPNGSSLRLQLAHCCSLCSHSLFQLWASVVVDHDPEFLSRLSKRYI